MSSINMVLKDTVVNRTGHCLNNWSLEITFTLAKFHKNCPQRFCKNIFVGFNSETEFNEWSESVKQPTAGSNPE